MRVSSTAYTNETNVRDLKARRDALEHTQQQISTGRRLVGASDDPVAAADAERARGQLARFELEKRAMSFAKNVLGQADGALSDATGLLQNARDTLVAAGNGSFSPGERVLLAEQLQQTRDQLLTVANRSDGMGGFLFGGNGTRVQPFADGTAPATPVAFRPNSGEQQVGTALPMTTSIDGESAFTSQRTAAGTSQNVFSVLDEAIALLRDPTATASAVTGGVRAGVDGVDAGVDALQLKRAQVGEQLRAVEQREQSVADGELHTRSHLADLVDVDMLESLSTLSTQQSALDAAMKTYAQVSRMSLFEYL